MGGPRIVVTGSSGHLGEALVRTLRAGDHEVVGIDLAPSPTTTVAGSISDRGLVRKVLSDAHSVIHTAALQQPHLASRSREAFVDTNVTGTLVLLEEAEAAGVESFVYTSSTSAFGRALTGNAPEVATWVSEDLVPVPRNVYGVTKVAAEQLCGLAAYELELPVVILRVARFFPEFDDGEEVSASYSNENAKANEYLYRRVDIEDAVDAHIRATVAAPTLGFGRFIVSATTPFSRDDAAELAVDAPNVVGRLFPDQPAEYDRLGWAMFPRIDRVYDNAHARHVLGWSPRYDFRYVLDRLKAGQDPRSPLAQLVGTKGYR